MTANKFTVVVTCQALSIDCIPGLLTDAAQQLRNEVTEGIHKMDDGDEVRWSTTIEPVKF